MSDTDAARIELYDIAKQKVDERFAELLMKMLPDDPDRHATKDDVEVLGAGLRTEMAQLGGDLRTEMADLRTAMAALDARLSREIHDSVSAQTRTLLLGLLGSVTALAIANTATMALVG